MSDEDVDEEIDDEIITTQQQKTSMDVDVPQVKKHVTLANAGDCETIYIPISFVASPSELQNSEAARTFKFAEHCMHLLKQNIKETDRDQVSDEHLAGEVRTVVPVDVTIVEHAHGHNFPVDIETNELMGNVVTQHGARIFWHLTADQPNSKIDAPALNPKNIIDEHMLKNPRKYTTADLQSIITVSGKRGQVEVDTIAHAAVIDGIKKNKWPGQFTESQYENIFSPPSGVTFLDVPVAVAQSCRTDLEKPITDFEKRCVNLENLTFTLKRGDGVANFCSSEKLNGAVVGGHDAIGSKIDDIEANTRRKTYILVRFSYKPQ